MNTKAYRNIVIIHNPNSKQNMKDLHKYRKLEHIVRGYATVKKTWDHEEVNLVAENCRKSNIRYLCIDGGDGTSQKALTTFDKIYGKEELPCVVPLRGGTANIIANSVGMKGNYKSILESLIDSYSTNKKIGRIKKQILEVDTDNGKNCGFLFANGLVYNFYHPYGLGYNDRTTGTPSAWKAVKLIGKGIYGVMVNNSMSEKIFDFPATTVEIDGEKQSGKLTMFATSVQNARIVVVPINRHTKEGMLQVYGTAMTGRRTLEAVLRMFAGGSLNIKDCIDTQAKQLNISSDEMWGYIFEGEQYACKKATVKPGRMVEFPVLD
jgi:diacylglycerol kinase family enzyme